MLDHQFTPAFQRFVIKDKNIWVDEAGEECSARAQHPKAFTPYGIKLRTEQARHCIENEIEALVSEHTKVSHVAKNGAYGKIFTCSNMFVLRELAGRVVQDRYFCTGRSKDWTLLTATRSQTKNLSSGHIGREPRSVYFLVAYENNRPFAISSALNYLRRDGPGPLVVGFD